MRLNRHRNVALALAVVAGLPVLSRPTEAQLTALHPSFYGSAEADTRNVQFYLLGMFVGMGGLGWTPYFNVDGYLLDYPVLGTRQTLTAVNPSVGLAYAGRTGGISFGAGYAWVHNPNVGAPGAEGGGLNGATVSFGAYHDATGRRPLHTQLLADYNFGSHYAWARGRASRPFGYSLRHPTRLGLEVVGQGGGKNGITYNEFDIGPTLEYAWSPNFQTTGVIGYKNSGGSTLGNRQSAAYFKLEFSLTP